MWVSFLLYPLPPPAASPSAAGMQAWPHMVLPARGQQGLQ